MKTIYQEHGFGCGVASLAMLTGKTYLQTLSFFPRDYPFEDMGCTIRMLQEAAAKSGLRFRSINIRKFKDRSDAGKRNELIKNGSNCLLKTHERQGSWHWLVWDKTSKEVRDPLKGRQVKGPFRSLLGYYSVEGNL